MKRTLFTIAIFCGISHLASAQTSGNSAANSSSVSSLRSQTKGTKSKKSQTSSLSNRKMYHWKDGQRATPTGHEATGTNGTAAPNPKDSATMQSDSTRHYK